MRRTLGLGGALLATCFALSGATCLPLIDNSRSGPRTVNFGISLTKPPADRTVAQGTTLEVEWSLLNNTGRPATVTLFAERGSDHTRTVLTQLDVEGSVARQSFLWDTTGFDAGTYAVIGRASLPAQSDEIDAPGRITVNAPPEFAFTAPAADAALPIGGTLTISWTGGDRDSTASLALLLDPDADHDSGNEVLILDALELPNTPAANSFDWSGNDIDGAIVAQGVYNLFARVTSGASDEKVFESGVRITTPNRPPTLTFTAPTGPTGVDRGATLNIQWSVEDPDSTPFVTILLDDDDQNDAADATPPRTLVSRQQDSDGTGEFNLDTTAVEPGDYFIQALVSDDTNEPVFVATGFAFTVRNGAPSVAFTAPSADVDFLASQGALSIAFDVTDVGDDVLVDLKIDPDDNSANGNEITILAQRRVTGAAAGQTFDWTGVDSGGNVVPDGIYRLFAVSSDGSNPAVTNLAGPQIRRRAAAGKPLVALLAPDATATRNPGEFLAISWRDDDPTGAATIDLLLDDDATPDESAETGAAPTLILSGREAPGDGVLDSFAFQLPTLAPGTYFIQARISGGGFTQTSVAQGRLIVPDPGQ